MTTDEQHTATDGVKPATVRRLTFMDNAMTQPVFTQVARECGVDFLILNGRFGLIKSTPCGQLTVSVQGAPDNTQTALRRLAEAGVVVEENFQ